MARRSITVTAGTPTYVILPNSKGGDIPATLFCTPGGGGTITVSFSGQEVGSIDTMDQLRYIVHPDANAISTGIFISIDSAVTAVKLEAGTADGTYDICTPHKAPIDLYQAA